VSTSETFFHWFVLKQSFHSLRDVGFELSSSILNLSAIIIFKRMKRKHEYQMILLVLVATGYYRGAYGGHYGSYYPATYGHGYGYAGYREFP
jgi:hypothetical protein